MDLQTIGSPNQCIPTPWISNQAGTGWISVALTNQCISKPVDLQPSGSRNQPISKPVNLQTSGSPSQWISKPVDPHAGIGISNQARTGRISKPAGQTCGSHKPVYLQTSGSPTGDDGNQWISNPVDPETIVDLQTSGSPNQWISKPVDLQTSGFPNQWISKPVDLPASGSPVDLQPSQNRVDLQTSGPNLWISQASVSPNQWISNPVDPERVGACQSVLGMPPKPTKQIREKNRKCHDDTSLSGCNSKGIMNLLDSANFPPSVRAPAGG